jgi:hypothetical protein
MYPMLTVVIGGDGNIPDTTIQVEESLSSSAFEMALYPTAQQLDVSGTWEFQHAITQAILLSSSITTSFTSVTEVEVLLRNIDFEEDYELEGRLSLPVSLVEFAILMTFSFTDSSNATLPSRNSLDNLIARAFSQPSRKSTFIIMLGLGRDPILNKVEDIEIYLVENSTTSATVESHQRYLSTIDITLIILSVLVFVAILCVLFHYHRNWTKAEETLHSSVDVKKPNNTATCSLSDDNAINLYVNQLRTTEDEDEATDVHTNPDQRGDADVDLYYHSSDMITIERIEAETPSSESSVGSQSPVIVLATESQEMSYDSSSTEKSEMVESSSSDSSDGDSVSAASSNSSNTTDQLSTDQTYLSSKLLGAVQPDYGRNQDLNLSTTSDQMITDQSPMSSKLLGAVQPDYGRNQDLNLSPTSDQMSTDHTSVSSKPLGAEQTDYGRSQDLNLSTAGERMRTDHTSFFSKLLRADQPDNGKNQDLNVLTKSYQMSPDHTTLSKFLGAQQPDNGSETDSNFSTTSYQMSANPNFIPSKLLGAEQPDYGRELESPRHMIDDRLSVLAEGSPFKLNDVNTISRSCDSAHPILEPYPERSMTTFTFRDEKSLTSNLFDNSTDESRHSSQRDDQNSVSTYRCRPGESSSFAISDSTSTSETSEQFRDNWLDSKRKAIEDTEEGSIDDIFQVGVKRTLGIDGRRISGPSIRISEFLNSVQVVGSVSETPEDSSIELQSLYSLKDNNSIDTSLEQSMAESIAEI